MRSSCHFTSTDETLQLKLTSLWDEFVVAVADAAEHVAVQTPLMMQTLDNKLQVLHIVCCDYYTHTHTFNGPFSGTTQVSRYQKGKTNLDFTKARDSEWQ